MGTGHQGGLGHFFRNPSNAFLMKSRWSSHFENPRQVTGLLPELLLDSYVCAHECKINSANQTNTNILTRKLVMFYPLNSKRIMYKHLFFSF